MVGAGSTYRDAAPVSRERARRLRVDPGSEQLLFSRHGSLVMDSVEVFAPVVFDCYRPRRWPSAGSLLPGDLPFRVRDRQTGRSRIAFRVFCAMDTRQTGRSCGGWRPLPARDRPTGKRS